MKRVSRDNGKTWYLVISEDKDSYQVVSNMMDYADGTSRQLYLRWDKHLCIERVF